MTRSMLGVMAIAAIAVAGCSRGPAMPSVPTIRLDSASQPASVEVVGLSRSDLDALSSARLTDDEWAVVLRATVRSTQQPSGAAPLAVAGRYLVGDAVRFTPLYPLDPGREYDVSFDSSRLSRPSMPPIPAARVVVSLPGVKREPSTVVTAVYPSGEVIPANQLRMYIQFSGPMGQQGGLEHIVLVDEAGQEIADALLPLDTQLWNSERTRCTVLFDPGRVKREILPNRDMGRPLREGETITFVVQANWPDAQGMPLKSEFRRQYRVGPPDERPLNPAAWRITAPSAGTRDGLIVNFQEALDYALLQRAIGVARAGAALPGDLRIEAGEKRWVFVPRDPWQPGAYGLVVQAILEDVAGNRIGRAFEVRSPGDAVAPEDSRPTTLAFTIAAR